jgi:hypothetical protein
VPKTLTSNLTKFQEFRTLKLKVGETLTELTFALDTSSALSMLGVSECDNCPAAKYKYTKTKSVVVNNIVKIEESNSIFWIPQANSKKVISFKNLGVSHNYEGFTA